MQDYIIRRGAWLLVVLLGITVITFGVTHVLPGDPARIIAGERASAQAVQAMREKWGLDEHLLVQYARYMGGLLRGDLGHSYYFRTDVLPAIIAKLPATAVLALSGLLIGLAIGIPAGVLSAVRQYGWLDRTVMLASLAGITLPAFLEGLLLVYFLGYLLPLFPIGGYGGFSYLALPAATLGIRSGAWYARVLRSAMLDILGEDYVRTARAKGLREFSVITRHGLRNALGPLVTMVGADMGNYLGGVLVVEKVFGWPGIGRQAWTAISFRDMPMIMGTVLFGAFCVVLVNLGVDVAQAFVDPRIRRR